MSIDEVPHDHFGVEWARAPVTDAHPVSLQGLPNRASRASQSGARTVHECRTWWTSIGDVGEASVRARRSASRLPTPVTGTNFQLP